MKKLNLLGETFNRLFVIDEAETRIDNKGKRRTYWTCKCVCGNIKEIDTNALRRGVTKSCGCLTKDNSRVLNLSHNKYNTKEYTAYQKMKERCLNKNSERYKNYGGRGISICDRWLLSFENFYNDMGDKPSNIHSLDRKDVNGNYDKENCRWATSEQQHNNKVNTLYITYLDETLSLSQMCRKYNLPYKTVWKNIKRGLTFETIKNKCYDKQKNIF